MPTPHLKPALHGVYAIAGEPFTQVNILLNAIDQALQGGAALIQYRDKTSDFTLQLEIAKQIQILCQHYQVPLIINDNIELAKACAASGVHLGKDDNSLTTARKILGDSTIIGISCYNNLERAVRAETEGADYVAFGSVYASPSKPQAVHAPIDLLRQAKLQLSIPICAIGGITAANAQPLIEAGADMLAVISGIFSQPDICSATRNISNLFK